MGRRPKNVKINRCVGLSTPREVCLRCEKPECIFEHGEPKNFNSKPINPEEVWIVKKVRRVTKTGEECITYLTQYPLIKIVASNDVRQGRLFTKDVAQKAVEKCKTLAKLPTKYYIVRKDKECERVTVTNKMGLILMSVAVLIVGGMETGSIDFLPGTIIGIISAYGGLLCWK